MGKQKKQRWVVVSPDGILDHPGSYPSHEAAEKGKKEFIERYRKQGDYAAVGGRRIPFAELSDHVVILPKEGFHG